MASRENLNPQVVNRVAREVQKMLADPQGGIRIILNERDITDIQADIEGPAGTPYEGGTFRCKLVVGSEFPAAPPRGVFLTKIFHPNVSTSGDICVNTLKKDWNPEMGLMHTLQVIRCLLIVPFPESALNEEASRLFLDSYEEYAKRAKLFTGVHATHTSSKSFSSSSPSECSTHSGLADAPNSSSAANVSRGREDESVAKVAKTMPQKKNSRSALKRL